MAVIDVFHNLPDDTIRIEFSGKPDEDLVRQLREAGFRYWPGRQINVATWSTTAEDLALQLGGGKTLEVREEEDDADARVDRFVLLARKAQMRAETERKKVHNIADNIPLGQPILVGHHSEAHARRDVERIDSGMRRTIEESEKAEYWDGRADGAARRAAQRGDPGVIARRIEKGVAENRKLDRDRMAWMEELRWHLRTDLGYGKIEEVRLDDLNNAFQDALQGAYALRTPKPPDDADWSVRRDWEDLEQFVRGANSMPRWYDRKISHNAFVLSYQRRLYKESGGIPMDELKVQPGYFVKAHGHWCRVIKVNRKSVTLDYSWLNMPPAKMEFTRIKEIQTPDEHATQQANRP